VSTLGREYLGRFRQIRVILAGRTCVVWEAMDDSNQQKVALKVLAGDARKDKEQIALLKQEYTVGKSFDHPYVLHIRECNVDRDTPYLVMDFFEGRNLKQEVRLGVEKMAWRVEKIIERAAEGLHYFHEQGWVHRDIKPDNLLVNDGEDLKLIDFAIAVKPKGGISKIFSMKSKIQGTRSYMSPEQIRGEAVDRRADVYSFGCTVFELLSGKVPYTAGNADDLLNKHLKSAVPALQAACDNVTPEFSQLISETLQKKREDRPASMADFLERMRRTRVFKKQPAKPAASE
jgi:serine/threonine protein kinase